MNGTTTLIIGAALATIMFGMGLSLTVDDFKRILKNPKAVLLGLSNQLLFLPIIGYLLVSTLELSPEISIGIMILASCPGGAVSNIVVNLAKGDLALSITLTAISSIISIFSIPFIVLFALLEFAGEGEKISLDVLQMIGQLIVIVILPVFTAMFIRAKSPEFALRMGKTVRIASVFLLVLITVGLLIKERNNIIPYFLQAGIPAMLLNLTSLGLGYITAYLIQLKKPQAITIAVESGIQNSALAMTIAILTLQKSELGIAAAIYTLVMYISGFMVIILGRR
ncbi:bile acid:sodium symporter family protein [Aquimarina addita]|uniref:Bile acid:sodium symporter family protein n=1 Tax=Aquimarina addita TaxID=870485 RepID=A0ABP6UJF5_9FLAO